MNAQEQAELRRGLVATVHALDRVLSQPMSQQERERHLARRREVEAKLADFDRKPAWERGR